MKLPVHTINVAGEQIPKPVAPQLLPDLIGIHPAAQEETIATQVSELIQDSITVVALQIHFLKMEVHGQTGTIVVAISPVEAEAVEVLQVPDAEEINKKSKHFTV